MRAGDFTADRAHARQRRDRPPAARIDAAIDHLNVRYELPARASSQASCAVPRASARERAARPPPTALEALRARCSSAPPPADAEGDETNLNRIRAPLFAFILAEEMTRSYLPTLREPAAGADPGHLAAGGDRAADHAVHADRGPRPAVPRQLERARRPPARDADRRGHRHRRLRRHRARAQPLRPAAVALAVRARLRDGVRRRAGLRARPHRAARTARRASRSSSARSWWPPCAARRSAASSPTTSASAPSFAVSACMALLSILAIARLPRGEMRRPPAGGPTRGPRMREIIALLLNNALHDAHGLAAMPAKIMLTGVCFYLVPLYIVSIGNTSAMAGRMLMVYAVMMVLIVPLVGERFRTRACAATATSRWASSSRACRRPAAAHLRQLPRALRRGLPARPGPGAVDRGAKRARGRALPGGDPHLRPRRGLRRLPPARAPRQRAGPADRERAGDLLGLPGRLRRASARCVLVCGIAFTIATRGRSTARQPQVAT